MFAQWYWPRPDAPVRGRPAHEVVFRKWAEAAPLPLPADDGTPVGSPLPRAPSEWSTKRRKRRELWHSGARREPRRELWRSGASDGWSCGWCGRADTPERRSGPEGARSLCNACGLRYAKHRLDNVPLGRPRSEPATRPPVFYRLVDGDARDRPEEEMIWTGGDLERSPPADRI